MHKSVAEGPSLPWQAVQVTGRVANGVGKQKQRMQAHRAEEISRREEEEAQTELRGLMAAKVAAMAKGTDLRGFMMKCGFEEALAACTECTRAALQATYRKLLFKYHPDRMVSKSLEERVMAEEVTKHMTCAWSRLPP
ncbi:hypothetical protein CYMTET_34780 [Cymbomonas tetramitiformis]|uniref:J domain-containing protein n=1 Tax=Cymbomonas tetramitiformis TaxID=36881 RepID=A0AAE0FAL1_9CHLO|nr:hypothetical protein CYMTET_34780 [Cymbomonas tetramitiformis]